MAQLVCMGANLQCSMGVAPSELVVLPENRVSSGPPAPPLACVTDCVPMVNVLPFGMCMSPANPEVASATAAAQGVLTPMPCIPVPVGQWVPGTPQVMVAQMPAVDMNCKLMCAWGGEIAIVTPGQMTINAGE